MLCVTTHDALPMQRQLAAAGCALGLPVHAATPTLPLVPFLSDETILQGGQVATACHGVLLVDTGRFAAANKAQQAALQRLLDKPECTPGDAPQCVICTRGVVWIVHDARSKATCQAAQPDLLLHALHSECAQQQVHWGFSDAPCPVIDATLQRHVMAARACSTPTINHHVQQALQRYYLKLRTRHKVGTRMFVVCAPPVLHLLPATQTASLSSAYLVQRMLRLACASARLRQAAEVAVDPDVLIAFWLLDTSLGTEVRTTKGWPYLSARLATPDGSDDTAVGNGTGGGPA